MEGKTDFKGYGKIYESSKKWQPEKGQLKKSKWCVTEKVHGANFCFILTQNDRGNVDVKCAKRKAILKENENFFNHKAVLKKLEFQITKIYSILTDPNFDIVNHLNIPAKILQTYSSLIQIDEIFIFGEIFGGFYPGTPKVGEQFEPVQSGIWYCPHVDFYGFDIGISLKPQMGIDYSELFSAHSELSDASSKNILYLNYEKSIEIFQKITILFAEPLFIGTYEQCLDYSIGFDSHLPAKLGCTPLTATTNKAEGVVIKPLKTLYVSTSKGKVRAILKKKIQEFSEVKYNLAEKPTGQSEKNGESEHVELIKYEMYALITENRLVNAISKIGKINFGNQNEVRELLTAFMKDVEESLAEECEELWQKMTASDKTNLMAELRNQSKSLIFQYFKTNEHK